MKEVLLLNKIFYYSEFKSMLSYSFGGKDVREGLDQWP